MTAPPAYFGCVLIADHYPDAAEVLALVLESYGFRCLRASCGTKVLELAEKHRPFAVLTELTLPGVDGKEVARSIRGQSWGENVLLVAVTKSGRVDDILDAEQAGFDRYLLKPILKLEDLVIPLIRRSPKTWR